MARIACPGCSKQYNVPDSAAGQTATCKACGKKFRINKVTKKSTAKQAKQQPSQAKRAPAEIQQPAMVSLPEVKADDDFWDDDIPEPTTSVVKEPIPAQTSRNSSPSKPTKPKPKKKKKEIRWGFDWGKVGGGLGTFLVAGGITLALMETTGRIYFWPAGVAIVGLFTRVIRFDGRRGHLVTQVFCIPNYSHFTT